MRSILNYIDGDLRPARSGATLDVHEPATGKVYGRVACSDTEDVGEAVAAAGRAFGAWSSRPAEQRAACLESIAALIEARFDEFAAAESRDTGKPRWLAAQVDIPRAIANLRFFAAAATQFASESHAMGDHAINYTLRQPLGVVGCISPWNLPLYLFTWKIAPAMASGNTVAGKPSELTPATAGLLGEVCREAQLPPGVLNIVHGPGSRAGAAIAAHPAVRAISFTGSTATGQAIAEQAAPRFVKLSLEMGGKNPTLVFADSDLEHTADSVVRAAFSNQGQICLSGSRILIEDSIYERFSDMLLDRVRRLRVGDPDDEDTDQGAVVSPTHREKILGYLDIARSEGGKILCGGEIRLDGRCADGWFVQPALIANLPNDCRTNQEEIFGPVATLQRFRDEEQALALANQSRYGLACSIWSGNLGRCHRLAARIECGIVWINCWMQRDLRSPFGGMKYSGLGREGGMEAMRFFTEPKNVCVEYGQG